MEEGKRASPSFPILSVFSSPGALLPVCCVCCLRVPLTLLEQQ